MFRRKKKEASELDVAIASIFAEMKTVNADSKEYKRMAAELERLYNLKECDTPRRVSPDTLAIVLGNAAVALIVVAYEQKHVITSKAGSFVQKIR